MTLGETVLYQTVIERLDDVLHCGKTNCLVILFSGAAGIVGLIAFAIYSFKSKKELKRRQQAQKQNASSSKKKVEKKKDEDSAKRKSTSKEVKPSPRVEKKKEKEATGSNPLPKVAHAAPKKASINIPTLDQSGDAEDWVTVVSRKDRKMHQTPREAELESPEVKSEKAPASSPKAKNLPLIETISKPVLPPPVEVIPISPPTPSHPIVENTITLLNDVKTLLKSENKPSDAKVVKLVDTPVVVANKDNIKKDVKAASPVVVSPPTAAVAKPKTLPSPIPAAKAVPAAKATELKKPSVPTPAVPATAPKETTDQVDPEWTEINRSAKRRNRVKKDN